MKAAATATQELFSFEHEIAECSRLEGRRVLEVLEGKGWSRS